MRSVLCAAVTNKWCICEKPNRGMWESTVTKKAGWESHARLNIRSVEEEEEVHFPLWLIIHFMKGNYFYSKQ